MIVGGHGYIPLWPPRVVRGSTNLSKIRIQLEATVIIEFDGGYYINNNMQTIEELIQNKIQCMTILVKEGTLEPNVVPSKIKLSKITYEL